MTAPISIGHIILGLILTLHLRLAGTSFVGRHVDPAGTENKIRHL